MRVLKKIRLVEFWKNPKHPHAEQPLSAWYQVVSKASWDSFADVRKTYGTADQVERRTVFNVGGNHIRVITVINYETRQVFIRDVLDHKDYDSGTWKKDDFGKDWKPLGPKKTKAKVKNKGEGRRKR